MNDEKLILLVEEHGELYDKRNPAYKLNGRKHMIWEQIGQQLGASGDTCMRRWTALRDRYGREIRKADRPSGSGAQFYKEWYLLDAMRFLKPHVVPRPVRFSLNVCPEVSTSAQHSPILEPLLSPTTPSLPPSPSATVYTQQLQSSSVAIPAPIPSPAQKATPQSLVVDVSPPSPSPSSQQIASPTPSSHQISSPSENHSRSRKRGNTDVANSMCEAIELFKKKCLGIEQAGNPAVESFGKMIIAMVSQMTPLKQTRAMQRIMEVTIQVQQE